MHNFQQYRGDANFSVEGGKEIEKTPLPQTPNYTPSIITSPRSGKIGNISCRTVNAQKPPFDRLIALVLGLLVGGFLSIWCSGVYAQDSEKVGPDAKLYRQTVEKAVNYLVTHQSSDGSWSSELGIGPTALAVLGLLRSGHSPDEPTVSKAMSFLEEYTQESGGIHKPGSFIANYETCVALTCFREANRQGKYDSLLRDAEKFLRGIPWNETRKKGKADLEYGGAGYGSKTRPDLSNTAYFIDALKTCGAGPDDKDIQKALAFVSRCQNLESEHNTTKFASKVNDGGFYYTPFVSPKDTESQTLNGGLCSYGAMTYSGLKSMVYAGLSKDDPRVEAAVKWIRENFDVKSNPGKGDAGLYYYYHTFAKALDAFGQDRIEDSQGIKHDWRKELTEELAQRQASDGSWTNKNAQWQEGNPNLATAFALLSLTYCNPRQVSKDPKK